MSESNTRPGYKHTELGWIPEEWGVKKLSELIEPNRGIRYGIVQPGKYEENGCLMLRSQDYSKGWKGPDEMHRVNFLIENQYKNARLKQGDLIMTVVGAGIGQVVTAPKWLDGAIVSRSTARISIDESKAVNEYILNSLISPIGTKQVFDFQKEGAQPVVSCLDLTNVKIPFPSHKEQQSIAAALSDMDAYIRSLEQLIEKKKAIKQAAMQELLTPKEDWEVRKLGEVFLITAGGDLDRKKYSEFRDETFIYPIYSNALTNSGLYGYSSEFSSDGNKITVTARGEVGNANFRNERFLAIGRLLVLDPKEEVECYFFTECINNFIDFANESTGVPQLTAPQISKYEVSIPSLDVQRQTAGILEEMNILIISLQDKIQKVKNLKIGMMQDLLTGKVRLV